MTHIKIYNYTGICILIQFKVQLLGRFLKIFSIIIDKTKL